MFNNFSFPKIAPFMRQCRKIWWNQRVHKWRHNIAHTRCMLNKQGYMHARTRVRAHARKRARIHTHTRICNIYLFHGKNDSRTRLNVTLHVYILCFYTLLLFLSASQRYESRQEQQIIFLGPSRQRPRTLIIKCSTFSRDDSTWGTPNSSRQVIRLTEGNTHWNPLLASIHRIGPEISVT